MKSIIHISKNISKLSNLVLANGNTFVIIDNNLQHLAEHFKQFSPIYLKADEEGKTLHSVSSLASSLLEAGADRDALIIGVGGGITTDIAGFTASNKMYGVLEIAATSYGFAVTTYVGQNLGAERMDRIKNGVGAACVIAVLTSLVIMTVMLVFGRSILSLFLSGTPQEISKTLEIAYGYLTVMSVCLPFLYLLFVFRSAIQGMGNTFLPMLSGIMELTARLAAGLTLPGLMGEHGIFYAEVLAWISAVVLLVPGYVATYRKESRKRRCVKAP